MVILFLLIAFLLGLGGFDATPVTDEGESGAAADEPVESPSRAAVAEMYGTVIFRLHDDAMQVLDNGSCAGAGDFDSLREHTVLSVVERDSKTATTLYDVELEPGELTAAGVCEWTVELGPMDVVERYYVTDREQIWGPFDVGDFLDPIVIDVSGRAD